LFDITGYGHPYLAGDFLKTLPKDAEAARGVEGKLLKK